MLFLRRQKCSTNGSGVQWFNYTRTRMIFKIVAITAYQIAKSFYEGLRESGGDKGKERGVHF